ncbi:MAG: Asp-tRNA(Asn)/Glu-tRNA(Gln) amidotransferase subunit GatB [Candidatus Methanosuratincola sp.]|jgi:aspartyl-tRNA(Asn)/glutamyl-tRNA(Gln) amidotransferase subunit B|nr:Asp-tRNA(Asn)/Glu-tRNA(Gln) amidotransferase subunit GatB [Candidatus Methanosuratincola sp.]
MAVAEVPEQRDGVVIGIEVHCQLNRLRTKLFCGCSTDYRGKEPNTNVCEVCLGHPGSLPRPNAKAVELAVMAGLALNSRISERTSFYRKNYYYVDMGKNFQISMYETKGSKTICEWGFIDINVGSARKRIRITRIQLEEDPAKLVHIGPIDLSPYTLVDYNRAGMALLEIVTEPDMSSPREARLFLQKLRSIMEHIGAFDGGLEGAMRCDANISIKGGTRVEIKNISSFKEVERALNFEISRQRSLLEKGERVRRETRHWDEVRKVTISLREKEEEHDYRYFPEPDIPPIHLGSAYVDAIRARMPELPDARAERFVREYGLPRYDAQVLTAEKRLADFFEEAARISGEPKTVSNWIMGDLLGVLHDKGLGIDEAKITPSSFAGMLKLIRDGTISGKIGKIILPALVTTGKSAEEVVRENDMTKIADREAIEKVVEEVFAENPKAVSDALSDEKAAHFLVGQVMRKTRGKGDPEIVNAAIRERLEKIRGTG